MSDFAVFSRSLIESAKFLAKLGNSEKQTGIKQSFYRASLYHSLAYVEAQVNDLSDHFSDDSKLSVHERAFLTEKNIQLEKGEFTIQSSLKMTRLSDRIEFLSAKFGSSPEFISEFDTLKKFLRLRNVLAHPKEAREITSDEVNGAIKASIAVSNHLALTIFGKGLSYASRSLDPKIDHM